MTLSRLGMNTGCDRSLSNRRAEFEAHWRRQRQQTDIIVGAATLSIFAVLVWIIGRALMMLTAAPGKDQNRDGIFSITDVWNAFQWSFFEPAWHALSRIPYSVWQFFEVSSYTLQVVVVFVTALACWIATGLGLAFVGAGIGRGFVNLGKALRLGSAACRCGFVS